MKNKTIILKMLVFKERSVLSKIGGEVNEKII
jgi:hypothetical protein